MSNCLVGFKDHCKEKYNGFKYYWKDKYKKHKNHSNWHYFLSVSSFTICIILYFIIPSKTSTKNIDFISDLVYEFDKPLIFHLSVHKFYMQYEKIIKFGIWKGLKIGCKCKEGDEIKIKDEKCSETNLKMNCEDILQEVPKALKNIEIIIFIKLGLLTMKLMDIF